MSKPIDKLPSLDPNVRGIFDRIVETAALERKRRKSDEYLQAERRREAAAIARREAVAREAKEAEAELYRRQMEARVPVFNPFTPSQPLLMLRESGKATFVR